jgi:hypothetical protein
MYEKRKKISKKECKKKESNNFTLYLYNIIFINNAIQSGGKGTHIDAEKKNKLVP